MSCNHKLVRAMRTIDIVRATLKTCTQGTVWIIKGDDTINLRKEGVEEICKNLSTCADLIQEVLTENEGGTQDN